MHSFKSILKFLIIILSLCSGKVQGLSWGPQTLLQTTTSGAEIVVIDRAVAQDSSGNALVVYILGDANFSDYRGNPFAATYRNGTWTTGISLNPSTTNVAIHVSCAMNSSGNAIIAWNGSSNGVFGGVEGTTYSTSTNTFGTTTEFFSSQFVSPLNLNSVDVGIDSSGNILMAWWDYNGNEAENEYRFFAINSNSSTSGGLFAFPLSPINPTVAVNNGYAIIALADGTSVSTWNASFPISSLSSFTEFSVPYDGSCATPKPAGLAVSSTGTAVLMIAGAGNCNPNLVTVFSFDGS